MPVSENMTCGLSVEEREIFFEVIEPTLFISDQEQFFQWTRNELQRIFPHGMLACGFGSIGKNGVEIQHIMSCNFPQEYLQTLQRPNEMMNSPILSKWMQEKQPILFEPNYGGITTNAVQSAWLDNFRRFGLQNLAAHGQCDVNSQTASYFSFSSIPGPLSPRHACILKLLVPHLHVALARVVANLRVKAHKHSPQRILLQKDLSHQALSEKLSLLTILTQREKEVMYWMSEGKSNDEIANLLFLGKETIKSHVKKILYKFKSKNRTEAISRAIETGFFASTNAAKRIYSRHDD
jgi:transcriptional regulator EpsA